MRTAIIGANGYIARNMIHVNADAHYADDMVLYGHQAGHIDGAGDYRQLDMNCPEAMEAVVTDAELIYFFVGKTGTLQGFETPELFLELNEGSLLKLLTACKRTGSKAKIVFPSTRLVYRGSEAKQKENAPKQFLTPYAVQKFACEQYLELYHRLYGINYCVLRICVPYGTLVRPVSSYGTLDMFLRQARENGEIRIYGDGQQKRTLTYIEDLCHILWRAGLSDECENDVYNVGGEALTIRALAEMVGYAAGAAVVETPWPEEARKTESGSTVFDSQKLDDALGHSYTMTVERWIYNMTKDEKMVINGNGGGGYLIYAAFPHMKKLYMLFRYYYSFPAETTGIISYRLGTIIQTHIIFGGKDCLI